MKKIYGKRAIFSELLSELYSTEQTGSQSLKDFTVNLIGMMEKILIVNLVNTHKGKRH